MTNAFASEWIKLRRRSLFYGSYAAVLAVACLVTVLTFSTAGPSVSTSSETDLAPESMS